MVRRAIDRGATAHSSFIILHSSFPNFPALRDKNDSPARARAPARSPPCAINSGKQLAADAVETDVAVDLLRCCGRCEMSARRTPASIAASSTRASQLASGARFTLNPRFTPSLIAAGPDAIVAGRLRGGHDHGILLIGRLAQALAAGRRDQVRGKPLFGIDVQHRGLTGRVVQPLVAAADEVQAPPRW